MQRAERLVVDILKGRGARLMNLLEFKIASHGT